MRDNIINAKMPKFEFKIKHVDRFEIAVGNTSYYLDKSTEKKAKAFGKKRIRQLEEDWNSEKQRELREIESAKEVKRQIKSYLEILTQKLNRELKKQRADYDHDGKETEKEEAVRLAKREIVKKIKKDLEDLTRGKKRVGYSSGFYSYDSGSHHLEEIKDSD
ncbi:MAG: hypothetical protein V3U92_19780 [Cellulophaga sp.]